MPHGLTEGGVAKMLELKKTIWVRPLAEANKSKKPMRLIGTHGPYGKLEQILGGHARQVRISLDKLELADPPKAPEAKTKPKPPAPEVKREPQISPSALEMFPVLREEIEATGTIAPPPPTPPPAEPKVPMKKVWLVCEGRKFYTPTHRWSADMSDAREYEIEGGANRAAGRLMGKGGRSAGKDVVVRTLAEAIEHREALAKPAPVVAPPPPVAEVPPPPPVVEPPREPEKATGPSQEMLAKQAALEAAMQNELLAFELLQHRKVELARAKHEVDVLASRRMYAYS